MYSNINQIATARQLFNPLEAISAIQQNIAKVNKRINNVSNIICISYWYKTLI